MSVNLSKASESDNGIITNGAVLFDSIFQQVISSKPTYTGYDVTKMEYYNSHTQIDANRILKIDLTYTGINLTQEVWTFYKPGGTETYATYTLNHSYSDFNLTKSEGTET